MSMQTIKLKGLRTNRSAAKYNEDAEEPFDESMCKTKEVDITVEYGTDGAGRKPICRISEGAVTGHESFYMEDILSHVGALSWCAGTPCRWDKLMVDRDNMEKLISACIAWSDGQEQAGVETDESN